VRSVPKQTLELGRSNWKAQINYQARVAGSCKRPSEVSSRV